MMDAERRANQRDKVSPSRIAKSSTSRREAMRSVGEARRRAALLLLLALPLQPGGVRRGPPGSEPGPPVEGAGVRIEEWRLDVDEDGIPLAEVSSAARSSPCRGPTTHTVARRQADRFSPRLVIDRSIDALQPEKDESGEPQIVTRSLCRKDANAFVRAVKRYGLESRIDEVRPCHTCDHTAPSPLRPSAGVFVALTSRCHVQLHVASL